MFDAAQQEVVGGHADDGRIAVLLIVPSLRRAGAETQVVDLVNALDPDRFAIHLCAFEADIALLERVAADRVTFHHPRRRSKYDLGYVRAIGRIIDAHAIEVVHCTLQFSLLVGWLARGYARRRPSLVAALHTTLNRGRKEELQDRLLYRWLLRAAARVIFVSSIQSEYWCRRYPFLEDRSTIVYNGIDLAAKPVDAAGTLGASFRAAAGIPDDAFVIACIAGFRPEKGHRFLIQALAGLPEDCYLLLAGDGETRSLIEGAVSRAGLGDRVHFLGIVADVWPVLAAADVSVLASTAVETFSIAMLESMAAGLPMVASRIGGMEEAVTDGETGLLLPPGNTAALRDALVLLHGDRHLARRMGQAGRARVERDFTVERMAHTTAAVLVEAREQVA
ncbi:glycosyltransferase family 4 protein [Halochromatium glycolicum]|nr:glycosyltransferase family 4 protein [Halochromatium glycolicum]